MVDEMQTGVTVTAVVVAMAVLLTEINGLLRLVLILIIAGIAKSILARMKREQNQENTSDDLAKNEDEKIALLRQMREEITQYTPGSWTLRNRGLNFDPPPELRIGVFGAQDSGKSAWLNSNLFAFKGNWAEVLTEGDRRHQGGESIIRDPIKLTDNITLDDNRGMVDLRLENVNKILEEIRGKRGRDPTVKVVGGMSIECPVFVFKYNTTTGTQHAESFVKEFVEKIRMEFGSYPIVVITFSADIHDADAMKNTFVMAGMAEHSIFTIENYTVADHKENLDKHIEILKLLKFCITRGDDNLVYRNVTQKERRDVEGQKKCAVM